MSRRNTMRDFGAGLARRFRMPTEAKAAVADLVERPRLEHDIQAEYFAALEANKERVPAFGWIYAIPNAGAGAQAGQAGKMRAEGVKAGVPDVFIPGVRRDDVRKRYVGGCYLEFKSRDGSMSKAQRAYRAELESDYWYRIVRRADEAFAWTCAYLRVALPEIDFTELPGDWHRPAIESIRRDYGWGMAA